VSRSNVLGCRLAHHLPEKTKRIGLVIRKKIEPFCACVRLTSIRKVKHK
jgi:hypothetical protein